MSSQQFGPLVEDWTGQLETDSGAAAPEFEIDADQEELEYEAVAESSTTIPGMGESGSDCGNYGPKQFCDECGWVDIGEYTCERRECPNCHKQWEANRTGNIVKRLAKGRHAEQPGIDRRVIHAVVSPPEGEIQTLNQIQQGFRKAYELAESAGIRGGVAVFHGFRVKTRVKREYREQDPEPSLWKWIREVREEGWRSLSYWSPHFHIIGQCRDLSENKPGEQDGWVVERLNEALKPYSGVTDTDAFEDMIRRVRYPLDHMTFEPAATVLRDGIRYFGDLAPSSFQPEEHLSEGVRSAIDRRVDELVGEVEERGDGQPEPEECDECESESLSPIFDAGYALQDRTWCEEIGKEQQRRLTAAFEWAIGEAKPPPGKANPSTEAEGRETLESLL